MDWWSRREALLFYCRLVVDYFSRLYRCLSITPFFSDIMNSFRRAAIRAETLISASSSSNRPRSSLLPRSASLRPLVAQLQLLAQPESDPSRRHFSTKSTKYRPRRRQSPEYRPLQPTKKKRKGWLASDKAKQVDLDQISGLTNPLDAEFGPHGADVLRRIRKDTFQHRPGNTDEAEEELRIMDYFTAEDGSTEELVAERRMLSEAFDNEADRKAFMEEVNKLLEKGRLYSDSLEDEDYTTKDKDSVVVSEFMENLRDEYEVDEDEDPETRILPNQLAFGEWSEMLVTVDRNTKLWRGGRLESYRALVIGGNLNGCAGFGVAKADDPLRAVDMASRHCKRNIFFIDRYQNDGLTGDLVGKQNSCTVQIRATDNGMRGNPLVREILKRFGVTNAAAKALGRRSPWNVVRATFKAILTHDSIEDIALKRGKRIVSVERAMRMQV